MGRTCDETEDGIYSSSPYIVKLKKSNDGIYFGDDKSRIIGLINLSELSYYILEDIVEECFINKDEIEFPSKNLLSSGGLFFLNDVLYEIELTYNIGGETFNYVHDILRFSNKIAERYNLELSSKYKKFYESILEKNPHDVVKSLKQVIWRSEKYTLQLIPYLISAGNLVLYLSFFVSDIYDRIEKIRYADDYEKQNHIAYLKKYIWPGKRCIRSDNLKQSSNIEGKEIANVKNQCAVFDGPDEELVSELNNGAEGYIYVLINASMPGLIKIGMTTRSVEERAYELSQSTGVPTPFIVAYEKYVHDCYTGERIVHSILESEGYRVKKNREFFNATLNKAIDVINQYAASETNKCSDNNNIKGKRHGSNHNSYIDSNDELGEKEYDKGMGYLVGSGNILQDTDKAIKHLRNAMDLGYAPACGVLAEELYDPPLDKNNYRGALECYNRGIELGEEKYYAPMADIYFDIDNKANALKCWGWYMKCTDDYMYSFYNFTFISRCMRDNIAIPKTIIEKIKSNHSLLDEMIADSDKWINNCNITEEQAWRYPRNEYTLNYKKMTLSESAYISSQDYQILRGFAQYLKSLPPETAVSKNFSDIEMEIRNKMISNANARASANDEIGCLKIILYIISTIILIMLMMR